MKIRPTYMHIHIHICSHMLDLLLCLLFLLREEHFILCSWFWKGLVYFGKEHMIWLLSSWQWECVGETFQVRAEKQASKQWGETGARYHLERASLSQLIL